MGKAQTGILGVVILTGIVLGIISVTYLWGQPLIQKNVDRAQVNLIMGKLEEINDAILYTASTGSNTIINLDLTNSVFLVDEDNNRIMFETYSTVPIIASVQEVPINFYELAEVRESITYNTTWAVDTDPVISGYEQATQHSNTTIEGVFYNVSVHENTATSDWDLVCIWKDYSITKASDCMSQNQAVTKQGVTIDALSILEDGTGVFALGAYQENKGVLGSEPSGIISAESLSLNNQEKINFYLTYRAMLNPETEEHKIIISCNDNCAASNADKELVIRRDNVIITSDFVTTYINLETQ